MAKLPDPKEVGWLLFAAQCAWGIFLYCVIIPGLIYAVSFFVLVAFNRFQPLPLIIKIPILLFVGFIIKMGWDEHLERQEKRKNDKTDD